MCIMYYVLYWFLKELSMNDNAEKKRKISWKQSWLFYIKICKSYLNKTKNKNKTCKINNKIVHQRCTTITKRTTSFQQIRKFMNQIIK